MTERPTVFVLGHRGMLGHVVARHLADLGLNILTTDERYVGQPRDPLIECVRKSKAAWVVNAIGRIKHKSSVMEELILTNSLLPLQLSARLHADQRLLHASTDCVFDGMVGKYRTEEESTATDDYGFSKMLGECAAKSNRSQVFRVSIIGPELGHSHGLLGWFFRQSGDVAGFTNHFWNGITTLEWAKRAADLILGRWVPSAPVVQLASLNTLSKYELLCMAAKVWKRHDIEVKAKAVFPSIDRTLVGDFICPSLDDQMVELRQWYNCKFGLVFAEPFDE